MHPMQVFRGSIISEDSSIIVANNHPFRDLTPSKESIDCSSVLEKSGELLGLTQLDSIFFFSAFEKF